MTDITINVCTSGDPSSGRDTTENPQNKSRRFLKRKQFLERKRHLKDKHKYNHRTGPSTLHRTPHQNGAFTDHPSGSARTQNTSLPRAGGATNPSPSASTHSLPSFTVTVLNNSSHEKPKAPVSQQSIGRSASAAGVCSHRPVAALSASQTSTGLLLQYLAIDCEMVGTGPKGSISQLARCSIVSYDGDVVYDKFINPSVPVTDYRTRWSGIRRSDLVRATPYSDARKEILRLLVGKVVIGHAIHNDFKVLGYCHPAALTRDTSRISLLNRKAGFAENECASLKRLTKAIFNRDIQIGRKGHSSVEDARATMELYKVVEDEWERKLASTSKASECQPSGGGVGKKRV